MQALDIRNCIKRGGYRKASESSLKSGRGLTTVVMFILVPMVMLKKRLDVFGAATVWQEKLPQLVIDNWQETGNAETLLQVLKKI